MKLNEISDNYGARYKSKRLGRGIGSGKGKTCGRGYKGQKARTGVSINGFEGGQMPLHRRLPKRGFKSLNRIEYQVVNVAEIAHFIEENRLNAANLIDKEVLFNAGLIRSAKRLVKLLGTGEIKAKVSIKVDKASKSAIEKIEAAKGTVEFNNN